MFVFLIGYRAVVHLSVVHVETNLSAPIYTQHDYWQWCPLLLSRDPKPRLRPVRIDQKREKFDVINRLMIS